MDNGNKDFIGLKIPNWLLPAIATAIQAFSAFFSIPEPFKTISFFSILILTSLLVLKSSKTRPPPWFVAAMLASVATFLATTNAGERWISELWANYGNANRTAVDQPHSFVILSTFEDERHDGRQSYPDRPLPGYAIIITDGEKGGMYKTIENATGTTEAEGVTTNGKVAIIVCGISQLHEVGSGHTTPEKALRVEIGLSQKAIDACPKSSR